MSTEQQRDSRRICLGFLIGIVSLAFLSLKGFAAEAQGGKTAGQQTRNQQQERIYLQAGFRTSKIIDQTVRNGQGQKLGEVDDLIMARNGKIKKAILEVGGFIGVGYRLVAVSFGSLRIGEKGAIVYDVTKQQIENHLIFTYRSEGLYEYYYAPPPPYGELGLPPPRGYRGYPLYGQPYAPFPPRGRYRGEYGRWQWEYYPERLRVSAILNRTMLNNTGEEVGEIDDLVIDENGKVEQIILSVGGFADIGQKLVALPFKPLKVTDLGIVYNVGKQELKNLPAFSYGNR